MKMLRLLLFLAISIAGCNRSDPIVLIQLHPKESRYHLRCDERLLYKTRDAGQTWTNLSQGMSYSRCDCYGDRSRLSATVYA